MGARAFLTNVLKGGLIGSGVNGAISYSKGERGYDVAKASTSGFFSGATIGIGWGGSFAGNVIGGSISGSIGEIVNQEFDIKFGKSNGYDLEKVIASGGIGAVANSISSAVVDQVNKIITQKLAKSIAETQSPAYRRTIRDAILERAPAIGSKELNIAINKQIKSAQRDLVKGANSSKNALTQAIERAIDYFSDKINSKDK